MNAIVPLMRMEFKEGFQMFLNMGGKIELPFKLAYDHPYSKIDMQKASSGNYAISMGLWFYSEDFETAYRFFIAHADPKINPAAAQVKAIEVLTKDLEDDDLEAEYGEYEAVEMVGKKIKELGLAYEYIQPSTEGLRSL